MASCRDARFENILSRQLGARRVSGEVYAAYCRDNPDSPEARAEAANDAPVVDLEDNNESLVPTAPNTMPPVVQAFLAHLAQAQQDSTSAVAAAMQQQQQQTLDAMASMQTAAQSSNHQMMGSIIAHLTQTQDSFSYRAQLTGQCTIELM